MSSDAMRHIPTYTPKFYWHNSYQEETCDETCKTTGCVGSGVSSVDVDGRSILYQFPCRNSANPHNPEKTMRHEAHGTSSLFFEMSAWPRRSSNNLPGEADQSVGILDASDFFFSWRSSSMESKMGKFRVGFIRGFSEHLEAMKWTGWANVSRESGYISYRTGS